MSVMSEQILDCLKRKRDICIKNIIPSQNTAFRWTPALREVFKVSQPVATVKLIDVKKITNLTRLSRLDMKTAIAWHYRTTISLAPKRGFASCESKKCLPKGRQRAFHLLFKFSRIEGVLEAPRAGGPVRVGLCRRKGYGTPPDSCPTPQWHSGC